MTVKMKDTASTVTSIFLNELTWRGYAKYAEEPNKLSKSIVYAQNDISCKRRTSPSNKQDSNNHLRDKFTNSRRDWKASDRVKIDKTNLMLSEYDGEDREQEEYWEWYDANRVTYDEFYEEYLDFKAGVYGVC